jgi:hypothetical protein
MGSTRNAPERLADPFRLWQGDMRVPMSVPPVRFPAIAAQPYGHGAFMGAAPAMLAGSAALATTGIWGTPPDATLWLAEGAWAVGSAEAIVRTAQGAHCERLKWSPPQCDLDPS